ncbi:hypothetical protein LshimejAT787_0310120 [Lyophyllum shimeji]|uniref:Protein kinase domain-containing protein n=1 Tax=Lyophyllum shimeji TaxID=47721 RepID=A0A9P3PIS9_LYOSH|nr:hypothetical protein LshimejAT787_0310120 [Lyophyllum shimeji]
MSARSMSERGEPDVVLSPSTTLCSASPALRSFELCIIPRLGMDSIDTSPFLDSFSGLIDENALHERKESPAAANVNMSYDLERFTDVKELDPEWDDEDGDEILVLSPKVPRKLSTIEEEECTNIDNAKQGISIRDFESLLPLLCRNDENTQVPYRKRDTGRIYAFRTFHSPAPSPEHSALNAIKDLKAPFLPRVHWTFQEADRFVMVMEHLSRKTLTDVVALQGALEPARAHLFSSELVQALSALHVAGVVHRDLRPENIIVDPAGHIILDGFGASAILPAPGREKASDSIFCTARVGGSSTFRAPELILGWAHNFAVDSWGFGLLLRYMLTGAHLINDNDISQPSWKDSIVYGPIAPCPLLEPSAHDLIVKCLEQNPAARLSLSGIKMHSYFATTDWKKVAAKRIRVPVTVPDLVSDSTGRGFPMEKTIPSTPKTGAVPPRETSSFAISDGISSSASANVSTACPSGDQFQALPQIFRMSSLLDDIRETETVESMALPDPTLHSALTLHDPPGDLLERDLTPRDRMALFFDKLDSERASILLAPSIRSTDTTPRPRKLRKSRSSIYIEQRFSTLSTSSLPNKLRKKSRPVNAPDAPPVPEKAEQPAAELVLPEGVTRIGGGIGFTYNIPAAARSSASVCSNTPQTCHAIFQRRLLSGLGLRLGVRSASALAKAKARRTLLSLAIPEPPEDQTDAPFTKDFGGSTWSLVTPSSPDVLNIQAGPGETFESSPVSEAGPRTPATLLCEEPEVVVIEESGFNDGEAQEVKAGDVDVTLRLVVPSEGME